MSARWSEDADSFKVGKSGKAGFFYKQGSLRVRIKVRTIKKGRFLKGWFVLKGIEGCSTRITRFTAGR